MWNLQYSWLYRWLAVSVLMSGLSSCATEPEMRMGYDAQMRIAEIQAQAIISKKETLIIDCSNGCGNAVIKFTDPRDNKFSVPAVTNTNDVVKAVMPSVVTGIGYIAGAVAVTRVIDDVMAGAGGNNTTSHNTTSVVGDDNTTTATTAVDRGVDSSVNTDNSTYTDNFTPVITTDEPVTLTENQ